MLPYLGQDKTFNSGQLIFENWSGGPVDVFFKPQPKFFPNLINANMQTWMPDDGGVRCWMSGVPVMEKAECWRVEGPHKSL